MELLIEFLHFREYPNEKPLIVFTVGGFLQLWQSSEEALCGFRSKIHTTRVRDFLGKLKEAGVEMVFFKDSRAIDMDRHDKWLTRHTQHYKSQIGLFDLLKKCPPLKDLIRDNQKLIRNMGSVGVTTVLKECVRGFGTFIQVNEDIECDLVVAAYATENRALAIVSNDTDFLIQEGDWRFWSLNHICQKTFTTIEYNKAALRTDLGLSPGQMPLFATLSGNDYVGFEDVFKFHKSLENKFKQYERHQNVAKFVRNYQFITTEMTSQDYIFLAKEVFNEEWEKFPHLLEKSFKSYSYETVSDSSQFKFLYLASSL